MLPVEGILPNFNRSAIIDIGANDGSPNTVDAKKAGFNAYSFDSAAPNHVNFLTKTPDAVAVEPDYARGAEKPRVEVPAHDPRDNKVFLIKSGVADRNGHLRFGGWDELR
mmetsp:Transcript_1698/g.4576  ORF Transcript_1698/g.4576 Transcript_1698/m.4576 type:complete len:110 (+) Transcript_1698:242-571(+)